MANYDNMKMANPEPTPKGSDAKYKAQLIEKHSVTDKNFFNKKKMKGDC